MNKRTAPSLSRLSRRERQIVEIVYAKKHATSEEVHKSMPDAASYSALRAQMRTLVEKGVLKYHRQGLKYVFSPTVPISEARGSLLARMVHTFFDNSPVSVVAALLNSQELHVSADELSELKRLITEKEIKTRKKQ